MAKRLKVVGYLRVSTDRQAEEGLGLDVQRDAIRTWARAAGCTVVDICADEGVSGSNGLDSRIALADALDIIRCGRAEGLVVYRLDRLARDLVVQETLLAEVRRMGATIHSTSAAESGFLSDDPDDPSRRLIRQILGAISDYERAMISLRLRAGRRRKAENGGYAFGSPPFGWQSDGTGLVPSPREQEAIALAKSLHREGRSIRAIAEELQASGHRTKRGNARWHPTTVARLLSRTEP